MSDTLLVIAAKAVKLAEKLGASQAEAYVAQSRSFAIDVENSAIKSASEKRDAGLGIRSVVDKRIGFAYVTTIEEKDIPNVAEQSVSLAKASIPDPDFVSFPEASKSYPRIKDMTDSEIANLSSEDAASLVVRTVEATTEALGEIQAAIEAQLSANSGRRAIANSLGVEGTFESTSSFLYSYPTIKTEDDQTSSFEYQISRKLNEIDPEWIGVGAAKNTLASLGGRTIDPGEMPVILSPLAVGTVLGNGFAGAVNAEEVQYGRSYISDAFGEEIASEELEIIDDSLLRAGLGSRPFDAEGYPSSTTEVLSKGILKNLLHNSYTANKDGVENTGNASRPSYAGIPSIAPSNFVITPGSGTLDDLISEVRKGVLVRNTYDRPNMTTGDLSAMVAEGHYIENGEVCCPVRSTLVGINMRELLKRILRIGDDTRVTTSVVSPSIVIESAKITSG
ncbi:MAG: TldD/PmbA family protein [Candidatus Thorarchaeota archaeon]|nr:MAG: TldD/PmbA family protein [Candidatus Thorarchaeota archaeon]